MFWLLSWLNIANPPSRIVHYHWQALGDVWKSCLDVSFCWP
jgi:hypothetical protein